MVSLGRRTACQSSLAWSWRCTCLSTGRLGLAVSCHSQPWTGLHSQQVCCAASWKWSHRQPGCEEVSLTSKERSNQLRVALQRHTGAKWQCSLEQLGCKPETSDPFSVQHKGTGNKTDSWPGPGPCRHCHSAGAGTLPMEVKAQYMRASKARWPSWTCVQSSPAPAVRPQQQMPEAWPPDRQ